MANPGNGKRLVADLLAEMSFHLIQPIVNTTITSIAEAGGYGEGGYGGGGYGAGTGYQIGVVSTVGMYVGALVIVGWQNSDAEVVTILQIGDGFFIAVLVNTHAIGETVFGPTFPIQQTTDPLFTQSEILNYVARAENEFLTKVPLIFALFDDITIPQGVQLQPLPATAIELERVAMPDADGKMTRLYEVAQTELEMADPDWTADSSQPPTKWYEDRAGNYMWGVAPLPRAGYPNVELLCSIRDSDVLGLLDGFLVPDILVYAIKWKALSYAWHKDGEQRSETLAKLAEGKFDRIVMMADRYLRGFVQAQTQRTHGGQ